jgi:hypothetical protein
MTTDNNTLPDTSPAAVLAMTRNLRTNGYELAARMMEALAGAAPGVSTVEESPAAGDAPAIVLPAKMPKHESDGGEYPSSESYKEGYVEGWNDAIAGAIAAQRKGDA